MRVALGSVSVPVWAGRVVVDASRGRRAADERRGRARRAKEVFIVAGEILKQMKTMKKQRRETCRGVLER